MARSLLVRAAVTLAVGLSAVALLRAVAAIRDPIGPAPIGGFEALRARTRYRTSQACAPCHRDHVASWARTFHRTMTQEATPAAIRAPFDRTPVTILGVPTVPWRQGDAFFLDTLDPRSGRIATHPIVRVTGSRRMQQFETREDDRYVRLPIAWSIDENRWLHLSEVFFHPDGEDFHANRAVWDLNCIFCHTTKPSPGLDAHDRLSSRSEELGIACEACHGPGDEHARRMRSPLRRFGFRIDHPSDPTLVNPGRLEKARSVQVCGHCHGQRLPVDPDRIREILGRGDPYTPGEDLSRYYVPVTRETMLGTYSFAPRFWEDGSPRLTAYEYQGVLRSPCYQRGAITCLSCHAMHAGDPRGQLRPDLPGDALCTQCHAAYSGARLTAHTRHRAESAGSRCVACHMPPVVYGIMTWHPTHEIASPRPSEEASIGKPDACTVCHSGRSLAWATGWSRRWWTRPAVASVARSGGAADRGVLDAPAAAALAGADPMSLVPLRSTTPLRTIGSGPASEGHAGGTVRVVGGEGLDPDRLAAPDLVRALFAGDVVTRTLAAARFAEPSPDPETEGRIVPLLAELLVDPYPNVRRTARDTLSRLTGRTDLPRALDPLDRRDAARRELQAAAPRPAYLPGWPFDRGGVVDRAMLEEWNRERKEVPVSIGE